MKVLVEYRTIATREIEVDDKYNDLAGDDYDAGLLWELYQQAEYAVPGDVVRVTDIDGNILTEA